MANFIRGLFGADPVVTAGYTPNYNRVLGRSNAIVYECTRGDETYALKVIETTQDRLGKIHREKEIWQQLDHVNIVKLHHCIEDTIWFAGSLNVYQIMEKCDDDLWNWFFSHTPARYSLPDCRKRINEIVSGLGYLHSQDPAIMHRDLKPENIFIRNGICKIGDFDLTVEHINGTTETGAHTAHGLGTWLWAAPEHSDLSMRYLGRYNLKVDIYPLGIIIMEFFTVHVSLLNVDSLINALKRDRLIPPTFFRNFEEKNLEQGLRNLILKMTEMEPKDRPTIEEVKESLNDIFNAANQP